MGIDDARPQEWDESARAVGWGSGSKTIRNNPQYNEALDKHLEKEIAQATAKQIGGNHYKKFKIQPAEFCHVNNIPYLEASAIKYLCRWRDKGGFEDLEKAKHFIDLIMEYENAHK